MLRVRRSRVTLVCSMSPGGMGVSPMLTISALEDRPHGRDAPATVPQLSVTPVECHPGHFSVDTEASSRHNVSNHLHNDGPARSNLAETTGADPGGRPRVRGTRVSALNHRR